MKASQPPPLVQQVALLALDPDEQVELARTLFDRDFYCRTNPGLDPDTIDPLRHFLSVGWRQGRDPNHCFSIQRYLEDNADVRTLGVNPLLHYLLIGVREGRAIHNCSGEKYVVDVAALEIDLIKPHFSPEYYRDRYADMRSNANDPLEHYYHFGWRERRDPCEWFSTQHYLGRYKDVAVRDINPFVHYITVGRSEGRLILPASYNGRRELAVDPTAQLVSDPALRALIDRPPRALRRQRGKFVASRISIHWVIPDFSIGSGGHMTVFRMIRWMELFGHDCHIWLSDHDFHASAQQAYDDIVKSFQMIRAPVAFVEDGLFAASGDVVFATGWQTVATVCHTTNFRERFYFVQDFEPSFHPAGTHALAAQLSYTRDLACICASPWLAQIARQQFNRYAKHFWLAFDRDVYFKCDARRTDVARVPRIAVYGRIGTARRCVQLVLLALEHLAKSRVAFRVDLFGEESDAVAASFPCTLHGILTPRELGMLYRECDLGICFSATNYSLVPQEMMACGLPVVELAGPSTAAIFPSGVVTLTGPDPLTISVDIKRLIRQPALRERQAEAALKWVGQFDWEKSARSVEAVVIQRLRSNKHPESMPRGVAARSAESETVKASVCIPTYNGGERLLQVVEAVNRQLTRWPFEILIVDSSSTDGSINRLRHLDRAKIRRIAKVEFGHGRTRNQCVRQTSGEFVAFLTQDALPIGDYWLHDLVASLEHFPQAAGAFGRHLAWPDASPFTHNELRLHFDNFLKYPLCLSRDTDPDRWESNDPDWRGVLQFYSDNNSCLRRSVWQKIPYPDVSYGEDQLWANSVIEAGCAKVYVPSATVYHSHNYTPAETFERAEVEAFFFKTAFGRSIYDTSVPLQDQLARLNESDSRLAREQRFNDLTLEQKLIQNHAKLHGFAAGIVRAADLPNGDRVPYRNDVHLARRTNRTMSRSAIR